MGVFIESTKLIGEFARSMFRSSQRFPMKRVENFPPMYLRVALSSDLFDDFEDRGRQFKASVRKL